MQRIHDALIPNGILVLSEKVQIANDGQQTVLNDLHLAFKRANGYSELEISQKRSAIENVLIADTPEQHQARLQAAGFTQVMQWFQGFNFISMLAVKA